MAAKASTWARTKKLADSEIHGIVNSHIDRRTVPNCNKVWEKDVVIDNGVPYIPLDSVYELLSENEELRETLYHKMTDAQEVAIQKLYAATGHSTRGVLDYIKAIERVTNNVLTGKEVFNFIYSELNFKFNCNLSECPADVSKLQYCWQKGWLPLVSFLVVAFHSNILFMKQMAPQEFDAWCKEVIKTKKPKNKSVQPF